MRDKGQMKWTFDALITSIKALEFSFLIITLIPSNSKIMYYAFKVANMFYSAQDSSFSTLTMLTLAHSLTCMQNLHCYQMQNSVPPVSTEVRL